MRYYVVLICALLAQSQVLAQVDLSSAHTDAFGLANQIEQQFPLVSFPSGGAWKQTPRIEQACFSCSVRTSNSLSMCCVMDFRLLKGFSIDSLTLTYSERGMVLYQSTDPVLKEPPGDCLAPY
jgi:hypothetical protein